ncbi:MAG: hypothetical protein KDH97_09570, partial [Calditrichaeota bacterium]|nr:hypothetical protein [Calditrichota bacterium]
YVRDVCWLRSRCLPSAIFTGCAGVRFKPKTIFVTNIQLLRSYYLQENNIVSAASKYRLRSRQTS